MTQKKKHSSVVEEYSKDIRERWMVKQPVVVKPEEIFNPDDWHSFPFSNRSEKKND